MSDIEWSPWIEHEGEECPLGVEDIKTSVRLADGGEDKTGLSLGRYWLWNQDAGCGTITHYRIPMADYRRIYGDPLDTHPDSELDADRYSVGADTIDTSDGSTASYYQLPEGATELQHLISYRNLNAQDGEIFRAIYRKGRASHSDALRDARKVLFYAKAEVERLEKYGE